MEIPGRVQNGVVVLDRNFLLPEGAQVSIVYPSAISEKSIFRKGKIVLPLV